MDFIKENYPILILIFVVIVMWAVTAATIIRTGSYVTKSGGAGKMIGSFIGDIQQGIDESKGGN